MAKLSIIIPSRDELFLLPTIADIFRNRRGETEVIAVLDSDKWPEGWKEFAAKYPDLHTIHNGQSIGMRGAINRGVASAVSRGARYIMKLDGHCMLDEGFDVKLQADMQSNWVVVPRRKRLDAENWTFADVNKPDIDYHYLSFPDDVNDFGGPGLNGKVWEARAKERADILVDEEMSSQGSGWFMEAKYFTELELMDEAHYGPFWNEFQEIGLKCWLSGGQVMVNKKTWYAHLHKGKKYGRGYHLPESALKQGAGYTKKWLFNEAWPKQTLPFKTLIERFWPVPTWPENWEELVYGERGQGNLVVAGAAATSGDTGSRVDRVTGVGGDEGLKIHSAEYGIWDTENQWLDVTHTVRELVSNDSLDIVVNNSTITPGQNPFRGKTKTLKVTYSYGDGKLVSIWRREKEWLIIGQASRYVRVEPSNAVLVAVSKLASVESQREMNQEHAKKVADWIHLEKTPLEKAQVELSAGQQAGQALHEFAAAVEALPEETKRYIDNPSTYPMTAPALNDYLIRKFKIPAQRLRGPMPIEIRDFHRDDLAQLFAELGFKRGAEIGVAEGKYSEVLLKANPECELLLVDPWHAYSANPQNKTKEKHEFAYNETLRRTAPYPNVKLDMRYSMEAVRDVADGSLDYVYIDGHHGYEYVLMDIIAWSRKVRSGGIVAGDDVYRLNEKWGAGPMEAIYHYTEAMKINPWFLINAHKSVDFFFVKP